MYSRAIRQTMVLTVVATLSSVGIANAAAAKTARIRRIDADHANPRRHWLKMGSPEYPNPAAVEELYGASAMPSAEHPFHRDGSTLLVDVALPPLAVAAVEIGFGDGAR